MKIWAKIMVEDRLIKDFLYEDQKVLNSSNYIDALQAISYQLDIAVPISIPTHFKHFEKFNRIKYLPRDFVEEVEFTSLILERVLDDKKKPSNTLV